MTINEERIRMADVARAAGVSLKSVSRVINRETNVSSKLREKVESAITQLAYVPDAAARSLAGKRSFTIGALFDNPSYNYVMEVQAGAYDACRAGGYHLRIDHLTNSATMPLVLEELDMILRHSPADGFIVTPPIADNPRVLDRLEQRGVPYVRLSPVLDPERSPAVDIDDRLAAEEMVRFILARGHRRIAFIEGPRHHGRAAWRADGFRAEMARLAPDIEPVIDEGDFTFQSGFEAGQRLVAALGPGSMVFACNDDMAAGVIGAAHAAGLRIPEDISICGFDDGWIARSVWPYLTTIHQPVATMARTAADLLINPHREVNQFVRLDYQLIERESVGIAKP